ncbi:hypothetical protein E1218_35625 [Kribbella turkmenica]|uniref:Uncharacterized protein n=2 Tax=Kribbella turkmenica TaxID=2530375 RepID=A0A4R4W043_9ACTN|nr:hypothetical protein E1218_35625 [Kribbella turkmenica]
MSVLAMCPLCADDDDVQVVDTLPDGRRRVRHRCGYEWTHGTADAAKPTYTFDELRSRFPGPADVDPKWLHRAGVLKAEYLDRGPGFDPAVAAYWAEYRQIFSADGLWSCDPQALTDFANSEVGARPANVSVFNSAWNDMGTDVAAAYTRNTIDYLLRGPDDIPLEDRLQHLLSGTKPFSMPGFKEALLTRVLCVMHPERFLSILKYTTEAGGKREIARLVYGLELPAPEAVNWTLGRLILWSNDVLRALVGEGFTNQQHAAAFLWWAKDQPAGPA